MAVHTGYWGCGAFGGNRELMALLQMLAASLAGLDLLVFHTGEAGGSQTLDAARQRFQELMASWSWPDLVSLSAKIASFDFEWGEGNGT